MLLELPVGKSVLPHSPTNKVSPVRTICLSIKRQMLSFVCPGVWIILMEILPMFMASLFSTGRLGFNLESLWATSLAWNVERSSMLPAVWSE